MSNIIEVTAEEDQIVKTCIQCVLKQFDPLCPSARCIPIGMGWQYSAIVQTPELKSLFETKILDHLPKGFKAELHQSEDKALVYASVGKARKMHKGQREEVNLLLLPVVILVVSLLVALGLLLLK